MGTILIIIAILLIFAGLLFAFRKSWDADGFFISALIDVISDIVAAIFSHH
jgi:hypothetical protein